ncbi:hypothetical protein OL229_19175 [Neisseriaceae bacterium JH1-16]|nr:hypothetical protein [Neisseriaceae bacterium JH1-16]
MPTGGWRLCRGQPPLRCSPTPGRALENTIQYTLRVSGDGPTRPEHLRLNGTALQVAHRADSDPLMVIGSQLDRLFTSPGEPLFDALKQLIVGQAYRHSAYNQVRAAELLGVTRNVLRTLLKRHGPLGER